MQRTAAVVTFLLALSTIALGHGNQKHIMGTVTSIAENSITVETTSKKFVTVEVSAATKFEKSGSPASLKDLKVGDKVVVHVDAKGEKLVATEVHFGASKKQSMEGMKGMESMDHQ